MNEDEEKKLQETTEGVKMESYIDKNYAITSRTILGYYGDEVTLRVPERFGDIVPERIGRGAFQDTEDLEKVILPNCVKSIGKNAFCKCRKLREVFIPGSIEEIEEEAFKDTSLLNEVIVYDYELTQEKYEYLPGPMDDCPIFTIQADMIQPANIFAFDYRPLLEINRRAGI